MAFNIGINVVEVDGRGAPAIAGAPTSIAGLILRSRRGPTHEAVRVSNFRQFVARFGGHHPDYVGTYGVDGFFLNGGREAYIARVVGQDSEAASVNLLDLDGAITLTLTAGYRGNPEVGAWGNELRLDIEDSPQFFTRLASTRDGSTPARLTSQLTGSTLDLSVSEGDPDRTLELSVDDPPATFTLQLNRSTLPMVSRASAEDIVNLINRSDAGGRLVARVTADSSGVNQIELISRTKGAASRVSVVATDSDTRDVLGFPDGNTDAAPGVDAATPYTEIQVENRAGLSANDWIRLSDGITTEWHQVSRVETRTVDGEDREYVVLTANATNAYDPDDGALLATIEFDLVVNRLAPRSGDLETLETWEKLTLDPTRPNYAPNQVNDAFAGSAYVVISVPDARNPDETPTYTFTARHNPAVGAAIPLGARPVAGIDDGRTGVTGTDISPATADYERARLTFETVAIQLLAVLDDFVINRTYEEGLHRAVTVGAIAYCALKGDCMFVGATPQRRDVAGAKAFGQNFRASKVYGALYWPWITVTDPIGSGPNPTKVIPPTGHVLGVYARIDQTRGVWKAPAGNEAVVRGALAVERDITDVDHTDLVKNGSVNGIRRIPGAGIVVDSSRTLSTDTRWLYVNVRLLFNYVKASLRDGLRWVKQQPNRDTLWNKVKFNAVTPFLLRLYQAGAFGTGTPDQVFTVVCGPENNPPEEVDLGNLKVEVYFYPSKPAETIVIIVGQQPSGAAASEQ